MIINKTIFIDRLTRGKTYSLRIIFSHGIRALRLTSCIFFPSALSLCPFVEHLLFFFVSANGFSYFILHYYYFDSFHFHSRQFASCYHYQANQRQLPPLKSSNGPLITSKANTFLGSSMAAQLKICSSYDLISFYMFSFVVGLNILCLLCVDHNKTLQSRSQALD